jgi:DNA-binding MarR family transcriptional regulator
VRDRFLIAGTAAVNPVTQARVLSHAASLFEGRVLLLAGAGSARDYGHMLESRGYHILRAATAGEAGGLLKRHADIALVIVSGQGSLDDDILAARKIRTAAPDAPWVEYVVLSAGPAAPRIPVSEREAEGIVSTEDRDQALSAIVDAFNLARLQRHQMSELSELERSLQEFRARTEAAMTQLLARARGRLSTAAATGEPAPGNEDMARAMEEERARARIREKLFGSFRLGHAGWMLMLVLAEAQGSGGELTVKSAAYAAGLPLSSALRKINEMCEDGLLNRRSDPSDNRRSFVTLTGRAKGLLSEYLAAVWRAARG